MQIVATIRSLHVYPVKGCAALDVDAITFSGDGLIVGDRSAMIVDAATGDFVSQRHEPRLAKLRATPPNAAGTLVLTLPGSSCEVPFVEGGHTRQVTVWDDTFGATDLGDRAATFLSDWLGRAVRLVGLPGRSPRVIDPYWAGDDVRSSFADLAPLLVTSAASLDDLNARRTATGRSPVEMGRFRPNVVLDGLPAWAEDGTASLRLPRHVDGARSGNNAELRFIKPCARCSVIELDPSSGEATGDEVLKSLAAFRAGRNRRDTPGIFFGQNAVACAKASTSLHVGDRLKVVATTSDIRTESEHPT